MKSNLIIILLMGFSFSVFSQSYDINGDYKIGGKVGIGTTNPSAQLEIKSVSNTDSQIHINTATDGEHSIIRFQDVGQSTWGLLANYPGAGKFSVFNYQNNSNALVFDKNGNVGIGVNSPLAKLHIAGRMMLSHGVIQRGGTPITNTGDLGLYSHVSGSWIRIVSNKAPIRFFTDIENGGAGNNIKMSIEANGNVGIGTANPTAQLEIKSVSNTDSQIHINTATDGEHSILRFQDAGQSTWGMLANYPGAGKFSVFNYQNNSNALVIDQNGNVGIGATSTGTHKLAVHGTIGAREIKVEAGAWSDFVFNNDYELKNLEEVESFIEANNHLPDVPSEKEVLDQGINLGEMDAKLLQKIEELTLYMIEMNKEVKALKAKNEKLEDEVRLLKKN